MQVRVTCKLHLREQCIEPWPVKKAHTAYDTMNRHTNMLRSVIAFVCVEYVQLQNRQECLQDRGGT